MISDQRYWNPVLETLPTEKLRALQLKKFKSILGWAYENSRFHRSLYDKAGITPSDISESNPSAGREGGINAAILRGVLIDFSRPLPG